MARAYPRSHLIGCSTAGEILGDRVTDGSVTIAVVRFEARRAARGQRARPTGRRLPGGGRGAGAEAAGTGLRGVLVLAGGRSWDASLCAAFMRRILPSVPVTCGLAGERAGQGWVLAGEREPRSDGICAVGFYGERVLLGFGRKGGRPAEVPRINGANRSAITWSGARAAPPG